MNKTAHIAGVFFALIFGFSFMFSKIALDYVSPMGVIAYRFLIAFIGFEILRALKIIKIRIDRKHLIPVLLVAMFQPVMYFIFETYGLSITTSSEAGMMIALIPIFVTILSALILKEKPTYLQLFFIIFSLSGIFLIQGFKTRFAIDSSFIGFLLLFGAVLSAAAFNIASRNASKQWKPYEITYYMMFAGALAFNIIYVLQLAFNHDMSHYFSYLGNLKLLGSVLYLGIIASIGGFFLVNFSLSKMPAHVSSIYANLTTVIAALAGFLFLNEALYWYHLVGGIMIIGGVYGVARVNMIRNKRKVKQID